MAREREEAMLRAGVNCHPAGRLRCTVPVAYLPLRGRSALSADSAGRQAVEAENRRQSSAVTFQSVRVHVCYSVGRSYTLATVR